MIGTNAHRCSVEMVISNVLNNVIAVTNYSKFKLLFEQWNKFMICKHLFEFKIHQGVNIAETTAKCRITSWTLEYKTGSGSLSAFGVQYVAQVYISTQTGQAGY